MTKQTTTLDRVMRNILPARVLVDDRHLLRQFADEGDQEAFAVLVRRHTAMVLGICRRVLPTAQDLYSIECGWSFQQASRRASRGGVCPQSRRPRRLPRQQALQPLPEMERLLAVWNDRQSTSP